jgi:inner membrane protein
MQSKIINKWVMLRQHDVGLIFLLVYLLSGVYIIVRIIQHHSALQTVRKQLNMQCVAIHVMPTLNWRKWVVVIETEAAFYIGTYVKNEAHIIDVYQKVENNPAIEATLQTDGVRAFISFAQRIYVTCRELHDGYEVRWSDMRFCYNRKLPFGVDVRLDRELNVKKEALGWRKKAWEPPFV